MSDNETFVADRPRNPFSNGTEVAVRPAATLGALASAEQQRALGELQAQIMLARMNPRDPQQCVEAILRDCSRVTLAQTAMYEYSRGGTDIKGPSIKLLEAVARRWGNIHSGFKIVHTEGNTSDVLTYAWDVETGYRDERQFQVRHIRDTRKGPVPVTDERDIYELIANMSQRRKRSCLQAVIPADVIDAAVEQCNETMHANVDTSVEGLKKLLKAFATLGVTQAQIEQRIQCRLEAISPGQVMQLSRIFTSIQDGISVPSTWFRAADPPRPPRQPTQPPPAVQQAPEPPVTPPPGASEKLPFNANHQPERAEPPPVVSPGPETSQEQGESEPEKEGESGIEFGHMVLGEDGEPIDGEVHLDPLTWAQVFLHSHAASDDRAALVFHNENALIDARTMSPEADALLDGLAEGPPPAPQAEAEVDPEEKVVASILQELPRLTTAREVIEFSKSTVVSVTIKRWEAAGRTGLVTSVSAAFQARLAAVRVPPTPPNA